MVIEQLKRERDQLRKTLTAASELIALQADHIAVLEKENTELLHEVYLA